MKARSLALLTALAASLSVVACAATAEEDDSDGSGAAVSTRNLGRSDFGLQDKELILTLDDGPGAKTKTLVDYLVREKVPAVFFMVGKNAKADPESVKYVRDHSKDVPGGLIIGNHSLTHTTPLPKQGVDGSVNEIMTTDGILEGLDAIKGSQPSSQFADAKSFFRPPYGAFTSLGAANIDAVNRRGADKYVGPIFWEIGGELTDKYSADWACWGKVTTERCQQGYIDEATLRGKGIMLVHDVHAKSVEMLTGAPGRVGLIEALRAKGFKFVGLRAHDSAAGLQAPPAQPAALNIRAQSYPQDNGTIDVQAEAAGGGADSVVIYFDQEETGKQFKNPANGTVKGRRFPPGQHTIRVVALNAEGKVIGQQATNFIVSAPISIEDDNGANSACVNYGALKRVMERGQYFDLYHGEVDCSAPGALQTPTPGECYKLKGRQFVSKLPQAISATEWAVEYKLTYDSDRNDVSTLSMVLETGTGNIVMGKRHQFRNEAGVVNTRRAEVQIDELPARADGTADPLAVDCDKGIWRGVFKYSNGSTEKYRFSKPGQ